MEEDDKDIELRELIRDFEPIEEERQDPERLVRVVGQRLTKIRKGIIIGQEWLLGRKQRVAGSQRVAPLRDTPLATSLDPPSGTG